MLVVPVDELVAEPRRECSNVRAIRATATTPDQARPTPAGVESEGPGFAAPNSWKRQPNGDSMACLLDLLDFRHDHRAQQRRGMMQIKIIDLQLSQPVTILAASAA